MSAVYANVVGKEFASGVTIDGANKITAVNANLPSLRSLRVGMIVRSIGGVPVKNCKAEQPLLANSAAEVLVVLGAVANDEFDLASDDEEESAAFQPRSALPPLPPEYNNTVAVNSSSVILEAVRKCGPGGCVVIMSENANPALPITLAAAQANTEVVYMDTVARMKTRQTLDTVGDNIRRSLEKGLWIFVEQATKSISLLRKLADCLTEVKMTGKMNSKSRVLLMCEPHPHFPESLMKDCVTLRCRLQNENAAEIAVSEDLLESTRKRTALRGEEVPDASSMPKPEVAAVKKKVKISNQVNIVTLEKSTFMEMSASAQLPADTASGEGITRVAKYSFGANEKFISLAKVSNHRFAIGTNSGYVVLIDRDGLPLIQFRPHKACIWDISFSSQFDFATACEDGTSVIFNYSLLEQELNTASVASFQNDVFAVTYAREDDVNGAVLSGGLSATVCVLHSDRLNSSFIPCQASIQAMGTTQQGHAIVGGGSGPCSLIDVNRCEIIEVSSVHTRKVPAVACCGPTVVTGSFDRSLRLWDVRNGLHERAQQTLNDVVTAVSVSEQYVAACSGANLFVWDQRMLGRTLAVKNYAWKDLTRGLAIDGDFLVTASVDGVARVWHLN